jgi:hypothetical protein
MRYQPGDAMSANTHRPKPRRNPWGTLGALLALAALIIAPIVVKRDRMANDKQGRRPVYRRFQREMRPGQPIQVTDPIEVADGREPSPLCLAMVETLRAYRKAGMDLLAGEYAGVREIAPPQQRVPCHIYVLCCPDGVLVRYDEAGEEEPKVRYTEHHQRLSDVAPDFSDQMLHVPDDPGTYVPKQPGPALSLFVSNEQGEPLLNERGEVVEYARLHPAVYALNALPADFKLSPPPARPPCLASLNRELKLQIHGAVLPTSAPVRAIPADPEHFIAHGVCSLPVGWQAIEIYPRLGEEYWRPEYAAAWAKLDLLSVIAQHNIIENALHHLDGRRAAREQHAKLLAQFEALLAGPEEPCHQFLKATPGLLCATHDAAWSKVPFGNHVSDFVFREPRNDYILVEIEAPYRELFRRNGHPRQELTHAIGQIDDWLSYIQDNKAKVENELGLLGISATPRTLILIGRSASLTENNRRRLAVMRSRTPGLTIMTYDDLLARARENLERLFGPLSIRAQNLSLYFYRDHTTSST